MKHELYVFYRKFVYSRGIESKLRVLALALMLLPAATAWADYQLPPNFQGWQVFLGLPNPPGVFGDPNSACQAQFQNFRGPNSTYFGAYPSSSPSQYNCDWSTFYNRCEGAYLDCGTVAPGAAISSCASGYTQIGFNQCVPSNEVPPAYPPDQKCRKQQVRAPFAGDPIVVLDGSEYEHETDYASGDGQFLIDRYYRSHPQTTGLQAINSTLRGAVGGWRFGFEMELHLQGTGGTAVTLHLPNGSAYDFVESNNQFSPAPGSAIQGDYTLSFVGTPPADWTKITGAATQWRVKDKENRTWLLQTFNPPNNYGNELDPTLSFIVWDVPHYNFNIARPIQMTMPGGYAWNYAYDALGTLQSISDSYGRAFNFSWNYLSYPNHSDPKYAHITNPFRSPSQAFHCPAAAL
jgi:hypothetical protein